MRFDELELGMSAELERHITAADIDAFARVTGDTNPVHVDEEAARQSRFGERIAHGMLTAGLISAVLGTRLPGEGCIYLGQTLRFTHPVPVGATITARVEVIELDAERRRARLATTCTDQEGRTVLEGEASLMVPE